jgi:aminopeptidase N
LKRNKFLLLREAVPVRCVAIRSRQSFRISAIRALGEFDDALLVEFFKERFYAEDNLTVQTEVLRAVGKCGDHTAAQFLKDAGEIKSPRNAIKRAAERALKEIENR